MKRLILVIPLLVGLIVSTAHADMKQFKSPKNQAGEEIGIAYSGVSVIKATTTNEVLLSSGAAVLYGIITSSITTANVVTFRNSNVVDGAGDILVPNIPLAADVSSYRIFFDYPVRYQEGLTVDLAANENGVGCGIGVLYLKME